MNAPSRAAVKRRVRDSVLLISPEKEDGDSLSDILSHLGVSVDFAFDWRTAESALRREIYGVVITERNLPDGNWADVLNGIQQVSRVPLLIVVSRFADEYLWAEVLNRCGFDVLAKPFVRDEVIRVVDHALNTLEPVFLTAIPADGSFGSSGPR